MGSYVYHKIRWKITLTTYEIYINFLAIPMCKLSKRLTNNPKKFVRMSNIVSALTNQEQYKVQLWIQGYAEF